MKDCRPWRWRPWAMIKHLLALQSATFALCHLLLFLTVKKGHFQDMINVFLESLVCTSISENFHEKLRNFSYVRGNPSSFKQFSTMLNSAMTTTSSISCWLSNCMHIQFFHKHKSWQCCRYCQPSTTIYVHFAPTDVSRCEIRNQGIDEGYNSRLHTWLDKLTFTGRAKTKLAMLAFLYCGEYVKKLCCLQ